MGSIHTGLEEERHGWHKLAEFYRVRVQGGVGLIVTGGIAPNFRGRLTLFAAQLSSSRQAKAHQVVTQAVNAEGGKICLQILHAGRYAWHPFAVAPSALKSPITPFKPSALSSRQIKTTIADFVQCAQRAQQAGYHGVEVMGSEGYLINQFLCRQTNHRTDQWGGDYAQRMQFALEIVQGIRQAVGQDFIIIYRLSLLDLVAEGSIWGEVLQLAQAIATAGANLINTGIGWHEARIPTIAMQVPRAGFAWATQALKTHLSIPVIAANRINTPERAEAILAEQQADLVSLARPLLADPNFVNKAKAGQGALINTCIACNQACLDHAFQGKRATCLVNPQACYETELVYRRTPQPKRLAVVGLGPAGLSFAITAAQCGHQVVAYEAGAEIGGQFNLARQIPGKQEFNESLRYFHQQLQQAQAAITVHLHQRVTAAELKQQGFDAVVLATGVLPRQPNIPGIDHPCVLSYLQVLRDHLPVGRRVAILGASGIGFDVASYLLAPEPDTLPEWLAYWGIDGALQQRGGLTQRCILPPRHEVSLLQRRPGKLGTRLGKTTGWIHRLNLRGQGVQFLAGVEYRQIDDAGLHIQVNGQRQCLAVDTIITCTGQVSCNELQAGLAGQVPVYAIGGAATATELDAKRAIREGAVLAVNLRHWLS